MTRRERALAVATAVVFAGGVVAAVAGPRPLTKQERATNALRDARVFSGKARTVRFVSEARYELSPENRGFTGSTINVRVDANGEVEFPDGFRILEQGDEHVAETIVLGKAIFHREGTDPAELLNHKWVDIAALLQDAGPSASGDTGDPVGALPALLRPNQLAAVVRSLTRPRFVRREHTVTTFRAAVGLGRFHAESQGLDAAEVEVSLRDKGAIELIVIRFRGKSVRGTMTYHMRRWQRPVAIAAPPANQIDPTPGLDEEAIAAFHDAPLLQPRGIPAGWVLDSASVLAPDETVEGCRQVEVDYTDPDDDENGYLDLYEFPVACAKPAPPGATPFTAGRVTGWQHVDNGDVMVQIQVGGTVVQAESDLTAANLAVILGQLVPLDLNRKPAALPGIATRKPAQ